MNLFVLLFSCSFIDFFFMGSTHLMVDDGGKWFLFTACQVLEMKIMRSVDHKQEQLGATDWVVRPFGQFWTLGKLYILPSKPYGMMMITAHFNETWVNHTIIIPLSSLYALMLGLAAMSQDCAALIRMCSLEVPSGVWRLLGLKAWMMRVVMVLVMVIVVIWWWWWWWWWWPSSSSSSWAAGLFWIDHSHYLDIQNSTFWA